MPPVFAEWKTLASQHCRLLYRTRVQGLGHATVRTLKTYTLKLLVRIGCMPTNAPKCFFSHVRKKFYIFVKLQLRNGIACVSILWYYSLGGIPHRRLDDTACAHSLGHHQLLLLMPFYYKEYGSYNKPGGFQIRAR